MVAFLFFLLDVRVKVRFIHKSVAANVTIKGRLHAVNIPKK
jgi:hypothetical protein